MNLKFMKKLCSMNKKQIQLMLIRYLKSKGYTNIKSTNMYIIAEGECPVCLLAHMDTVFSGPPRTFYFDQEQNVLWSPDGLGADDRAGIYVIINLIEKGFRPSLIFTDLEERGGIGAHNLVAKYPECPFEDCRALIQLDRQGTDDAVFYECENYDFTNLILRYGFNEEWGTFTDISIIAPQWKIAAVNLSVGYLREHTCSETLNMHDCHKTIDRVANMLCDCNDWPSYCYIPAPPRIMNPDIWWSANSCAYCGRSVKTDEGVVVDDGSGKPEYALLLCDSCYNKYKDILRACKESPSEDDIED